MTVASIILFFLGCFGVFWIRKRAFDRRNIAGVEEFKSYGTSLLTRVLEKIAYLCSWLFIISGVVKFISSVNFGN